MQLTDASRVECSGKVKYSGIDIGNVMWKNGTLIIQLHNGRWSMNLEYDVSPGNSHKCIALSPGVIKKLICKAQLVIELKTGSSSMNFLLKPHTPKDDQDMKRVYEKLLNIQKLRDDISNSGIEDSAQSTIITEAIVHRNDNSGNESVLFVQEQPPSECRTGNESVLSFHQPLPACSTSHAPKKRKTETVTPQMLMQKQYDVLTVQEEKFVLEKTKIKLENIKLELEIRRLQQWANQKKDDFSPCKL